MSSEKPSQEKDSNCSDCRNKIAISGKKSQSQQEENFKKLNSLYPLVQKLFKPTVKMTAAPKSKELLQRLSADWESLFSSQDLTDCVFMLGPEETVVKAHKIVLTTRVPYFKNLLGSGMEEAVTGTIRIPDVDADVFKQVLAFIYGACLPHHIDTKAEDFLAVYTISLP